MKRLVLCLGLGLLVPAPASSAQAPMEPTLTRVSLGQLLVTKGTLGTGHKNRLTVEVSKMRAVVPGVDSRVAELRFKYLGPTPVQERLASGERRQQVGLKLRAQDGCNVVYVMWRIAPRPGLVVSVKSNPREHTSAECSNRGYQNVRPRRALPLPKLLPGVRHTLRTEWKGRTLRISVDGALAWEGELPPKAFTFQGPVGLRTDNGRFELELLTQSP